MPLRTLFVEAGGALVSEDGTTVTLPGPAEGGGVLWTGAGWRLEHGGRVAPGRAGARTLERRARRRRVTREPNAGRQRMLKDLAVALRTLRRRPAYALVAIGTLAASIGAVTLLFSVLRDVMMRPLPYREPTSLVAVLGINEGWRDSGGALADSWDRAPITLSQADAFRGGTVGLMSIGTFQAFSETALDVEGNRSTVAGAWVGEGVFETLGVQPLLGRLFHESDHTSGNRVAVIHHDLWQTHFGGRADLIGRTVRLDGEEYRIVGVLPQGFFFPEQAGAIWAPIPPVLREAGRDRPLFHAIGRMAEGVGLRHVNERLGVVAEAIAEENPRLAGLGARAVRYREELFSTVQSGLRILMGTTVVILLMACVNLASVKV